MKASTAIANIHLAVVQKLPELPFLLCNISGGAVLHENVWGLVPSFEFINPLTGTLKPQSNESPYSNTVIGTLAVDGWAVTFGTARRGLGGLRPRPVPSSLYQTKQPTHRRPVNQLHSIRCGTVQIKGLILKYGVNCCVFIIQSTLKSGACVPGSLCPRPRSQSRTAPDNLLLLGYSQLCPLTCLKSS